MICLPQVLWDQARQTLEQLLRFLNEYGLIQRASNAKSGTVVAVASTTFKSEIRASNDSARRTASSIAH